MIRRREVLAAGMAAPFAAAAAAPGLRRFELTAQVSVAAPPGPVTLFLPLLQSASGQQAGAAAWRTDGRASLLQVGAGDAPVLQVQWERGPCTVQMRQRVTTQDRAGADGARLSAAERRLWTQASPSLPTDGIVAATAARIVAGCATPRARLRAIYDWVAQATWRDPAVRGCGTGDVATMLRSGRYGGKCADISSLTVALARAASLPARDAYGIRLGASRVAACLGRAGDVTGAQHCRAEVFLDGEGWLPIDPADLRKAMLEERLAPGSARAAALRERLFGAWEMNWASYNNASDIVLPGGRRPNFPFLMYPCAFTAAGQPDCLDAAGFAYALSSVEV